MSYNPNFTGASAVASRQLQTGYVNGTGSTIAICVPVSTNTSGQIVLTDVSNEALSLGFVGLTNIAIPSAANGGVINGGRLQNVTTGFAVGDAIYVGSTPGTLTNVKPNAGSNGFVALDFVIFVGVLVKNEFNPSQTDIQLFTQIVGQL